MKKTTTALFLGLTAMVFTWTSCDKSEDLSPKKETEEQNAIRKHADILLQEEQMTNYDKWVYIDLESGKKETNTDYREWVYGMMNRQTGEMQQITKTIPERANNEPKKWHIAFHLYDPMTNGGEVMIAGKDTTSLDQITELPKGGTWTPDKPVWILVDMEGMMQMPPTMGYSKGFSNPNLHKYMRRVTMGQYEIANKERIFIVKFKNGSFAAIKFTDITDATGKKKQVSFDYKFVRKK